MNEFQYTTDMACDTINAIAQLIEYPIGDNARLLDLRVGYYSDAMLACESYYSDNAKNVLSDVLSHLEAYFREPTGDRFLSLSYQLLRFQSLSVALSQEVKANG